METLNTNDASEDAGIKQLQPPATPTYSHTIEEAAHYFLDKGFRIAPRTIAWHCQTNLLDCQKFTQGNVLKWKITKQSLNERIETLNREGIATAGNGEQLPASMPAGNSAQQPAPASELGTEIIKVLTGELEEKNKQIAEFQAIVRDHNQQFGNLNRTIQLSNETIQQLNRTLALPQVKDVMASMNERGAEPDQTYSYHSAEQTETDENESDHSSSQASMDFGNTNKE